MKQLTVRGVDEELHWALKAEEQRRAASMNQVVLALLKEAMGLGNGNGRERIHHDLDRFIGTWTEEDAEELETFLAEHRTIDEELWR